MIPKHIWKADRMKNSLLEQGVEDADFFSEVFV